MKVVSITVDIKCHPAPLWNSADEADVETAPPPPSPPLHNDVLQTHTSIWPVKFFGLKKKKYWCWPPQSGDATELGRNRERAFFIFRRPYSFSSQTEIFDRLLKVYGKVTGKIGGQIGKSIHQGTSIVISRPGYAPPWEENLCQKCNYVL